MGIEAAVFESSSDKLEEVYDIKGKDFTVNLNEHGLDYCQKEIEFLKSAKEKDVTKISSYLIHYSVNLTNKNAQRIRVKDFSPLNIQTNERNFKSTDGVIDKFRKFYEFASTDQFTKGIIDAEKYTKLIEILESILGDVYLKKEFFFLESRAEKLFNSLIDSIKREIARKTASPPKPTTTGFQDFAINRIEIERHVNKLVENMKSNIDVPPQLVGNLGPKGDLICEVDVVMQNGNIRDGDYKSITKINKSRQKEFARCIEKIFGSVYLDNLFELISDLNSIEGIEEINTIYEIVLFKKCFKLGGAVYKPSNGESSMLLLHNELRSEKDVYILDEPEKSLGNDYINDVIVPMISDKAKVGKKVFISTHDANIAVRTLPYTSIFRKHDLSDYSTYAGNPFSNHLVNVLDASDKIDWKLTSMKTLEGGVKAFGERGKIYGNA